MTISGGPYRWKADFRDIEIAQLRERVIGQRELLTKLSEDKLMLERQIRRLRSYMSALSDPGFV